ncbi:hypothetical protein ARMSODRAFT_1024109 [Armillaria solidipes]|uniref:Uncharacterized protein n=1 Tax=Armillaria solidipes TaxID=1076256 RepID=A0A2H3AXD2_9AGAR|nr:hypothetical protein ARMSODRAFT_1024109 [Armillaria solidipes]
MTSKANVLLLREPTPSSDSGQDHYEAAFAAAKYTLYSIPVLETVLTNITELAAVTEQSDFVERAKSTIIAAGDASRKNQIAGDPDRGRKLSEDEIVKRSFSNLEMRQIELASNLIIDNISDASYADLQGHDTDKLDAVQAGNKVDFFSVRLYGKIMQLIFNLDDGVDDEDFLVVARCRREKNYCPFIKSQLAHGNSFKKNLFDKNQIRELSAKVEAVISIFYPVLQDYARGALDYQFSPRHKDKSPHAEVHNSFADREHLLLSKLGDPDRGSLTDWRSTRAISPTVRPSRRTYVLDLPGYGKTRLQFEGILEFFVIYFSCSKEELTWATGSGDVAWTLNSISEALNPDLGASQEDGIEKRSFYMVLYSRLVVLRRFLRYLLDFNVTPLDARRRLLLIQACPPCLSDNTDIFLEITKISHLCSTEALAKQTELALQDCNSSVTQLLGQHSSSDCPKFHVLIDEVQVVAQKYKTLSYWWKNPALVAFVKFVHEVIHPRGIIAGASGLPVGTWYDVPLYASGRSSGTASLTTTRIWPNGSETNKVREKKTLRDWVLARFPELVDVPGLLDRIEKWLPSRPRLVASLLEMYVQAEELLGDRIKIPYHKILSQAFCVSTGFQPMDGIIYERTEGEIPDAMAGCSFKCSIMTVRKRFEQDGLEQDRRILQLSSRMLYWWILSRKDRLNLELDHDSAVKLIDIGLAPLPSLPAPFPDCFMRNVDHSAAMTEPYTSLSYMALLSSKKKHVFKTAMAWALLDPSERGSLFEDLTVFVLMENLGRPDGCCLSDVICFRNPAPIWAASRYRLVGLVKNESDDTFTSAPVTWNSGASPRLGFKSTQPEDFHQWLSDPHGVPFIFPQVYHGAEGFAVLENIATKERVILAVQNKVGRIEPLLDAQNVLENLYVIEGKLPADTHMLEIWPTLTSDIAQAENTIVEHEKVTEGLQRREDPRVIHVIATVHDDIEYQRALDKYDSSTLGVLRLNAISACDEHVLWVLRSLAASWVRI